MKTKTTKVMVAKPAKKKAVVAIASTKKMGKKMC